ncbi:hypothetical protein [Paenibacillus antarcticus]|uniref:hypothetical protein n=1 Tax=Paenibacillus antarcticus TaxID=253703 RepID=UPI0011F2C8D0|nr:hypothetical protein [Paenibacillus antarcticus]
MALADLAEVVVHGVVVKRGTMQILNIPISTEMGTTKDNEVARQTVSYMEEGGELKDQIVEPFVVNVP